MSDKHTTVQYQLRIPEALRERIRESSEKNNRSMNSDIIARLEKSFTYEDDFPATFDVVGEHETRLERLEKNMSRVIGYLSLDAPNPD